MNRILFLSHTLPYPPDGGVFIRTYNILRELARRFEVKIHAFDRTGAGARARTSDQFEEYCEVLQQFGDLTVTAVPQAQSRMRLLADHGRSVMTARSAVHFRYDSAIYGKRLQEYLGAGAWDVVHVESLDLVRWMPALAGQVVACTHHNVESDLLSQRADVESNPLLRAYFRRQATLTMRDERLWGRRVAANVVVSDADGSRLSEIATSARFDTIPNGVDTAFMTPGDSVDGSLVFVGGAGWFPNKDGFEHFCAEMLPLLRSAGHDPMVYWIGRAPEAMRSEYRQRYGVYLTGYLEDIRPVVRKASCYVMPIRVGGGSRLKLLDAWSMGKAVVSTTAGAAGVDAVHERNILIADDPAKFTKSIIQILEDSATRHRLGRAGRETAERLYSWDIVGHRLYELYSELATGEREPLAH